MLGSFGAVPFWPRLFFGGGNKNDLACSFFSLRLSIGMGCYSGSAVMIPLFLFFLLFFFHAESFAGDAYFTTSSCSNPIRASSPSAVCPLIFPAVGGPNCEGSWYDAGHLQDGRCYRTRHEYTQSNCNGSISDFLGSGSVIVACNCPGSQIFNPVSHQCQDPCPSGQTLNPSTGQCQSPCPPLEEPQDPYHQAVGVGISFGTFCQNNCALNATLWQSEDSNGFDIEQFTFTSAGAMCGANDELPNARAPKCDSPRVVRVDGTCGSPDPTCPSWQNLENHACVNKPCDAGKTLKCGTVNGAQSCSCAGLTDCEPGTTKDAFGNCVTQQSCPEGRVQDPVTGVCGPPKDESCPTGTHREGMTCVKDPGECQVGTWFVPGCGCISDVNQCVNRNSNDIDGDGTPNANDDDADGDGIPNSTDNDADNDGIPNSLDSTPSGPGSSPVADPTKTRDTSKSDPDGDLDGDGDPNSSDPDRDGDGIPNGDDSTPDGRGDGTGVNEGQCDPETQECSGEEDKPGKPAEIGDQFYKGKEDRSFQQVWSAFIQRVQQASIVTAGSRFFTVSIGGGSCPNWEIPATFISPSIPITLQCSSQVTAGLRIAGYIVLIIAAWVAFRIALL